MCKPFSDESLEKIAEETNNTNFGLASIWTKDISTAHKLAAKLELVQFGLIVTISLMHPSLVDTKSLVGEEKWGTNS